MEEIFGERALKEAHFGKTEIDYRRLIDRSIKTKTERANQ